MKRIALLLAGLLAPAALAQGDGVSAFAPRFRWGFDLHGGALASLSSAAVVGASGRLGYQFNQSFGLTASTGTKAIFGATRNSATIGALQHLGLLAEFTFADRVTLGVGPVLGVGAWGVGFTGALEGTSVISSGVMPGGDLRLAFRFGDSAQRRGLVIGIDVLVLVAQTTVKTDTSTAAPVSTVGFIPTLSVGYDAL